MVLKSQTVLYAFTLSVEILSLMIKWPRENDLFLKQLMFLWIQFQIGILGLISDLLQKYPFLTKKM